MFPWRIALTPHDSVMGSGAHLLWRISRKWNQLSGGSKQHIFLLLIPKIYSLNHFIHSFFITVFLRLLKALCTIAVSLTFTVNCFSLFCEINWNKMSIVPLTFVVLLHFVAHISNLLWVVTLRLMALVTNVNWETIHDLAWKRKATYPVEMLKDNKLRFFSKFLECHVLLCTFLVQFSTALILHFLLAGMVCATQWTAGRGEGSGSFLAMSQRRGRSSCFLSWIGSLARVLAVNILSVLLWGKWSAWICLWAASVPVRERQTCVSRRCLLERFYLF